MIDSLKMQRFVLPLIVVIYLLLSAVAIFAADEGKERVKKLPLDSKKFKHTITRTQSTFACSLNVISPENRTITCSDSIAVVLQAFVAGGIAPYDLQCTVNGKSVTAQQDTLQTFVALLEGENLIGIHCIFTDAEGDITQCADTLVVEKCTPLTGTARIISPLQNAFVCDDSVDVAVVGAASGGVPGFSVECFVNGVAANVAGDTMLVRIPLNATAPLIGTTCIWTDAEGNSTEASDVIIINKCDPLTSSVSIISPLPQSTVCGNEVEVTAVVRFSGGVGQVSGEYTINGLIAGLQNDTLRATVPLVDTAPNITVFCVFTDSLGNVHQSADTVGVQFCPPLQAGFTIISPDNRAVVCEDSVIVTAVHNVSGGQPPYRFAATINNIPATINGDTLRAVVPLPEKTNFIGLHSLISDAAGNLSQFADTLYIEKCSALQSQIDIIWPVDEASVCADSIEVIAVAKVSGGILPVSVEGAINGFPAVFNGDTLHAKIPFSSETTLLAAYAVFTDAQGDQSFSSDISMLRPCDNFKAAVQILYPAAGAVLCDDSVTVKALARFDGGENPVSAVGTINGVPLHMENDTLSATIPLLPDATFIGLYVLFTDAAGNIAQAADTTTVLECAENAFQGEVKILYPKSGQLICEDSISVTAIVRSQGGIGIVANDCKLNGKSVSVTDDTVQVTIVTQPGTATFLGLHNFFTDANGNITQAADTVTVLHCEGQEFRSSVAIFSPLDGAVISTDSILVKARVSSRGGRGIVTPEAKINGKAVVVQDDSVQAWVPVFPGPNFIGVHCIFTDAEGNITQAADTATVFQQGLTCDLVIISPQDSRMICHFDSVDVTVYSTVAGVVGGVRMKYTINGRTLSGKPGEFTIKTAMKPGWLPIIASIGVTDSAGVTANCSDSIIVFFDKTPPQADINFENLPEISGTVWDDESGIDWIKMVSVKNRTVEFDEFEPGARKVSFRSLPIDRNKPSGFTFKVKNLAGCFEEVDPIYLQLAPGGEPLKYTFKLPPQDRFMRIQNRGVDRITLVINGKPVHFLLDVNRFNGADPVYRLPQYGRLAIDIHRFLSSDSTDFELICEGLAGTTADFLIADRETDQVITEIREDHFPGQILLSELKLGQNYPNPFNANTLIEYQLPQTAAVRLRIFNLLGQEIITLVDERQTPGIRRVRWDGRNHFGKIVASGVYIYTIEVNTISRKRQVQVQKLNFLR